MSIELRQHALKSTNVFIDSSTFRRRGLRLDDRAFASLIDLCQGYHARLLLTDIVLREIRTLAEDEVNKSLNHLQRSLLRGIPAFDRLAGELAASEPLRAVHDRISKFVDQSSAIVLNASKLSASPVFERYFSQEPPFSSKKKSEFPDAFNLEALHVWSLERGEPVYIVSEDKDLASACHPDGPLIHIPELQRFVGPLLAKRDELFRHARELFQAHLDEIEDSIAAQLSAISLSASDPATEILEFEVKNVALEDWDVVGGEEDRVFFDATAYATLAGTASVEMPHWWHERASYQFAEREDVGPFSVERTFEVALSVRVANPPATDFAIDHCELLRPGTDLQVDLRS